MTMRCVVGVWTDDAFSHKASALCATPASAYVWTGADDGVVIRYVPILTNLDTYFQICMYSVSGVAERSVLTRKLLQVGQQREHQ